MSDYISRQAVEDAMTQSVCGDTWEVEKAVEAVRQLPAADVVSKADIKTLLEQTEKELVKGTDKYSIAYNFIVSVIGIIKCNIMQMGEKDDQ